MQLNKKILINLLPGLLPLFIFIIADEIWGTRTGLVIAVSFGILELGFTYFKTGKFEKFIFFDTGFIVLLGGVSIVLDNEIFFKLKPALIEGIFAIILAGSVFGRKNIILEMSKKYMKSVQITSAVRDKMDKNIKTLLWLTIVHILLVVYSSVYLSKEAWAFISGVLFYLMIAAFFMVEVIKTTIERKKFSKEEFLPVVNEKGEVTGKLPRSHFHFNKNEKLLHPVVHLHLINSKGEIFLQKRPAFKEIQPDKWDTAVGGHITYGETVESGLNREAEEEIGISDFKPLLVSGYIWETDVERELVYMFYCKYYKDVKVNNNELSDGRFWPITEIRQNLGNEIFTPNFIHEFRILEKRFFTE